MRSILAVLLLAAVCNAQFYYPYSYDDYDADYPIEAPVSRYSHDWYPEPYYRSSRGKKGKGGQGQGGGYGGGWGGSLNVRYGWQKPLGWGDKGWDGWSSPQEHHFYGWPVIHLGGPPTIHQGPPKYVDTYYPVTVHKQRGWGWGWNGGGGGGGGFGGGFE